MSVVKSKRSESVLEFLHTAGEPQIYTIRKCTNAIPKRYTFYLGVGIAESAKEIYRGVKRGNSIYPTNQHEAQLRRDCFIGAYAELENLASQVEVAQEAEGENLERRGLAVHFSYPVLDAAAGLRAPG